MATHPVFLPGESQGQRNLAGRSSWVARIGHDLATKPPILNCPPLNPIPPFQGYSASSYSGKGRIVAYSESLLLLPVQHLSSSPFS